MVGLSKYVAVITVDENHYDSSLKHSYIEWIELYALAETFNGVVELLFVIKSNASSKPPKRGQRNILYCIWKTMLTHYCQFWTKFCYLESNSHESTPILASSQSSAEPKFICWSCPTQAANMERAEVGQPVCAQYMRSCFSMVGEGEVVVTVVMIIMENWLTWERPAWSWSVGPAWAQGQPQPGLCQYGQDFLDKRGRQPATSNYAGLHTPKHHKAWDKTERRTECSWPTASQNRQRNKLLTKQSTR